jgi:hypothetical protein
VSFDPILELAPSTNSLKVIRTQAGEADDAMTRRKQGRDLDGVESLRCSSERNRQRLTA